MGKSHSIIFNEEALPSHIPNTNFKPTFDPQYGFKGVRKPRESKLSEQEVKALKLTAQENDYCAHLLVDYLVCYKRYCPIFGFCEREAEAYKHCEMEDLILRMKEYEREKRLRIRELKKKGINVS